MGIDYKPIMDLGLAMDYLQWAAIDGWKARDYVTLDPEPDLAYIWAKAAAKHANTAAKLLQAHND